MATVPVGVPGGQATGAKNAGVPVLGGMAGRNQYSPVTSPTIPGSGITTGPSNGIMPINTSPVTGSASVTGRAPSTSPTAINTPPTAASATGVTGTPPVATPPATGNPLAGYTPQQSQQLQKQLTDIYGKGEGGLLYSLINNLGGSDSSYMQAYEQAMQHSTAEGQSTIATQLGNAGISANSSVSAIEQGDYLSSVTAQEGLQEQQLLQTQQQEAISLTQGLQQSAQAENSTSWLNTLSQVGSAIAPFADIATGGISGAVSSIFSKPSVPTLNTSGSDPLGLAGQGAIAGGGIQSPLPSQAPTVPVF